MPSISRAPLMGVLIIISSSALSTLSFAAKNQSADISMFPPPSKGYSRYVIAMPEKKEEQNYKIEVIPYITSDQADCNKRWVNAKYEQKDVAGWGYSYVVISNPGAIASTRMACPSGVPTSKEINVLSTMPLMRYNSRLPIVIYVPENMKVKYRVWSTKNTTIQANLQ